MSGFRCIIRVAEYRERKPELRFLPAVHEHRERSTAMERNKGSEREFAKKRRRAIINWLVYRLVAVGLIVACVISFISTQATLQEKRQEKADLESAIEQAKDENLELEKFVDAEDIEGYMEKAAIEDLNYAYPNERRFYDTSRN